MTKSVIAISPLLHVIDALILHEKLTVYGVRLRSPHIWIRQDKATLAIELMTIMALHQYLLRI